MGSLRLGRAPSGLDSLFQNGVATGLSNLDLLERFARCRDQAGELAFATLVARHGPMVRGVCRRMLRDPADVDDAFQATFLVLVRRATSVRFGNSLGSWLYGVSVRVARRVRLIQVRRPRVALEDDRTEAIPDRSPDAFFRLDRRLAI